MRYIVRRTETDGEFEFTHIEEKQTLEGQTVEVIKGVNKIKKENLEKTLADMITDRQEQFEIIDNNINELTKMVEAINNLDK